MSNIKTIRDRLGLTQTALAEGIGCTQGNIGHYETKGQTVPPDAAKRLINFCASRGFKVTFEDIYGKPQIPYQTERRKVDPVEGMQLVDRRVATAKVGV